GYCRLVSVTSRRAATLPRRHGHDDSPLDSSTRNSAQSFAAHSPPDALLHTPLLDGLRLAGAFAAVPLPRLAHIPVRHVSQLPLRLVVAAVAARAESPLSSPFLLAPVRAVKSPYSPDKSALAPAPTAAALVSVPLRRIAHTHVVHASASAQTALAPSPPSA